METLPVAPDDGDDGDAEGEVVAVGVFEGAKEDERAEVLDATGDEGEGEGRVDGWVGPLSIFGDRRKG